MPRAKKTSRRATNSVTLADVAIHAGVSAQTISRAIRNPDQVSVATLELVTKSILATGYVPNLAASNLASNRSMTVAAIIPDLSSTIFADGIAGLDEVLAAQGYHLFIGATGYSLEREEEIVRAFLGRRPDGVLIVGTMHTPGTRLLLERAGIPVVETWSLSGNPIDAVVGYSNEEAISEILKLQVANGYKHPTFAGWLRPEDSRAIDRLHGFTTTMKALLPEEPIRVIDSGVNGISLEAGRKIAQQVLEQYPETDVLICSSDIYAEGVILELRRNGVDVPGRLAVTGLGDFDLAKHLSPSLTTVKTPNREIGEKAGEFLLGRMMDRSPSTGKTVVDLGFEIISRQST
jgi:LacI family gluconate utilization system Gnt-I transcriptional repressor